MLILASYTPQEQEFSVDAASSVGSAHFTFYEDFGGHCGIAVEELD
jgi:hypothetical protein